MKRFIPRLSDIIALIGLCSLSHGLFLFRPWVAYTVTGAILMAVGFLMAACEREP